MTAKIAKLSRKVPKFAFKKMENGSKISLEQNLGQRLLPIQVRIGRLLEMNSLELEDEVKRALEELPALEVDERSAAGEEESVNDFNETAEEIQLADYAPDEHPDYVRGGMDRAGLAAAISDNSDTLGDVLLSQFDEQAATPTEREIARYIIGSIDSNGYMTRTVSAIVQDMVIQTGLEVSVEQARTVWKRIRSSDPAGVGAVDLRDALLLQLKRKTASEVVDDAVEIVSDYFDLFSLKHYDRIISNTGMSRERLAAAVAYIRQLNPKPGSVLESSPLDESSRHIIPDFRVDVDNGRITVTLLNDIPSLTIEQSFSDEKSILASVAATRNKKETLAFIRSRRDEAKEFISLLQTRQQTLFRIMSAIVAIQKDFFLTDDTSRLRPMILKDIAAVTGDDISVISRAAANKYVATSGGVYPLKIFFNERAKIGGTDDSASGRHIAARLREIVDAEDKNNPLTDENLVELFKKEKIDIARRTVAKYRERLGIPVARLRKEI